MSYKTIPPANADEAIQILEDQSHIKDIRIKDICVPASENSVSLCQSSYIDRNRWPSNCFTAHNSLEKSFRLSLCGKSLS